MTLADTPLRGGIYSINYPPCPKLIKISSPIHTCIQQTVAWSRPINSTPRIALYLSFASTVVGTVLTLILFGKHTCYLMNRQDSDHFVSKIIWINLAITIGIDPQFHNLRYSYQRSLLAFTVPKIVKLWVYCGRR